jgi:hypothetical protein
VQLGGLRKGRCGESGWPMRGEGWGGRGGTDLAVDDCVMHVVLWDGTRL